MYERQFFCTPATTLVPAVDFFSRALGCGARTRPASTLRRKCGPRPGSLERTLGVHSRTAALFHGIAFRRARAKQVDENPNLLFFHFVIIVSLRCCFWSTIAALQG